MHHRSVEELIASQAAALYPGPAPSFETFERRRKSRRRIAVSAGSLLGGTMAFLAYASVIGIGENADVAADQTSPRDGEPAAAYSDSPECSGAITQRSIDYFLEPERRYDNAESLAAVYTVDGGIAVARSTADNEAHYVVVREDGTTRAVVALTYSQSWESWVEDSARWCAAESLATP